MIIGAILQASSFSYAQMIVARIITGLGNGLNVSIKVPHLRLSPISKSFHCFLDFNSTLLSRRVLARREARQLHHDRRFSHYFWYHALVCRFLRSGTYNLIILQICEFHYLIISMQLYSACFLVDRFFIVSISDLFRNSIIHISSQLLDTRKLGPVAYTNRFANYLSFDNDFWHRFCE